MSNPRVALQQEIVPQPIIMDEGFMRFMVSWGLEQKDFNQEALKKMDGIFIKMQEINTKTDFQLQVQHTQAVFNNLGALGQQFNKRSLVKVAEGGNALVGLSSGIANISQQLGTALPAITAFFQPLAALNPVFMGIGCAFTIASLCGLGKRRRSKGMDLTPIMKGMKVILDAVMEVHKAMIEVHKAMIEVNNAVINVHKDVIRVYELVAKLGDYLIQDVKVPLIDMLSIVETNLQRTHIISVLDRRELFLQELHRLVNRMNDHADGILDLNETKLKMLLTDLHDWMGPEKSCNALLTGRNLAQTGITGHEAQWIKQVLSNPNNNLTNLIGFLAIKAEQFTGKKLPDIDIGILMNLQIWSATVSSYLTGLNNVDLRQYHPSSVLDEITVQMENYQKFIQFTATSEDLYKGLFDLYDKSISFINAAIERKFVKLRNNAPNGKIPGEALTLKEMFPQDSGDRKELDQTLDMLDDFHMLFSSYTCLGGLKKLHEDTVKQLLTREKIFSYKADFYNRIYGGPNWGQDFDFPEYYRTIRTAIFSMNGKPVFAALVRQYAGITIDLFDLSVEPMRKLEGMPKGNQKNPPWSNPLGYKDSMYYDTIRMNIITINGQPEIYVMAMHIKGFYLFSYNPQTNNWKPLTDAPLGAANGKEHIKLYNEIINVAGQPKLFQLVITASKSKLSCYDPKTNTWDTSLPDVPRIDADWTNTLCANVMEINGRQIFCKAYVDNSAHFRIDIYDPVKKEWFPPVLKPIGNKTDYDNHTLRTAVITVDGVQKLYLSIWHSKGLQLNELKYDPVNSSFTLLSESPPWQLKGNQYKELKYKTNMRLLAIKLSGESKLLAITRHSMGYEKHLYDPMKKTWKPLTEDVGNWPLLKDEWGWDWAKHYVTIQANVVDISPGHQDLFISGRSAKLDCWRVKIAPELFAPSLARTFFKNEMKKRKPQPHEMNLVLEMIKIQVELCKENIAVFEKLEKLEKLEIEHAPPKVNGELQEIVDSAENIHERLKRLTVGVLDDMERKNLEKKSRQILMILEQLEIKQDPVLERKLLTQLITYFNDMDLIFNDCLDNYRLSQNVQSFLKSIRQYMKTANQPIAKVSELGQFKYIEQNEKRIAGEPKILIQNRGQM